MAWPTCRHYLAGGLTRCGLGIPFIDVRAPHAQAFRLPCKNPLLTTCAARVYTLTDPTPAELAQARAALEASGQTAGVLTCPRCQERTLGYRVTPGQLEVVCATPGCVRWTEPRT